jgi:two-component system, chemotaxis family, chemotaxis protein CheY
MSPADATVSARKDRPAAFSSRKGQFVRVLIVEDSPATRAFIRAALTDGSLPPELELVEASGGFEALRLLPRGPYAVVITDINMPDINGLELLTFIRSNGRHAPTRVLLISTQSADRDRERGLALGADGFLAKPFTAQDLREAVAKLLPAS